MGAEVIKIEAPGQRRPRPHLRNFMPCSARPRRVSFLDLKQPEAIGGPPKALASRARPPRREFRHRRHGIASGLGADALRAANPNLILSVRVPGLGRTGPEAHAVAYWHACCNAMPGFADLNRHPRTRPARVSAWAWLDPMCGLMARVHPPLQASGAGAPGAVARVDFLDDRGHALDDGAETIACRTNCREPAAAAPPRRSLSVHRLPTTG